MHGPLAVIDSKYIKKAVKRMEWVLLVLLGAVAAVFGSIVGLGGGIIIVPALMLLAPSITGAEMDHAVAVGVSLTVLIVTALASTMAYAKRGIVDFRLSALLFAASGPAALLGSAITGLLPQGAFQLAFGCSMLGLSLLMMFRDRMKPFTKQWPVERTLTDASGERHVYGYGVLPALVIGFFVGFISGLFGIGGGSLFVPLMVLLFRFPPHVATATSVFVIFLSAILGSGMHAALGEVDWLYVLALAPGAWIGGKLGARIALRLTGNGLMRLLRGSLLALAAYLIVDGLAAL